MDILSRSGDICDQSRSLCKIDRNFACFGPQFFSGNAPEFLDSIYKFEPVSDYVAKFRSDRPRELGDYPLKKELEVRGRAQCEATRRHKTE